MSQPQSPGNQDHGDGETCYRSSTISTVALLWINHLAYRSSSGCSQTWGMISRSLVSLIICTGGRCRPLLQDRDFSKAFDQVFTGSFVNFRTLLIGDYDAARLVHQLGEINCDVTRDQISLSLGILFGLAIESDRGSSSLTPSTISK